MVASATVSDLRRDSRRCKVSGAVPVDQADGRADGAEPQPVRRDEREHMAALRAQRHAQPDLAGATRRESDDPIEADRRERRAERGEPPQLQVAEPLSRQLARGREGCDVRDRLVGLDRGPRSEWRASARRAGRPWAPPASWKAGSRRQARRMLPTKPTICCVSGSPKSTTTPIGSRRRSIPVGLQKQSPPSPTEDPFTAAGSPALQQCCSREDLQLAATRATDSPGNERNDRSSGAALALQVLDRRPHLFSVPRRPVVAGRQPRHPGVPTEATSLTARRCEPNSWHNARKRSVTATDGSSSTAVPS